MRITDIVIDRFSAWRKLELSALPSGVILCYGPNEAGKTTLLRFLRGVLYGFEPNFETSSFDHETRAAGSGAPRPTGEGHSEADSWAGSLRVEANGNSYEIRRVSQPSTRGLVSVIRPDGSQAEGTLIDELLGHTVESVFERVFAIGLQELQELATLHEEKIARRIYDVTLGPEGHELLQISRDVEIRRRRLFDAASLCSSSDHRHERDGQVAGELARELKHIEDLGTQLAPFEEANRRHAELCRRRQQLDNEIADLTNRRAGMQSQLRGHEFLNRVWPPWNQVRELKEELDGLPIVEGFPVDAREQLETLEAEIDSATRLRDTLLAEAEQFRNQADERPVDPTIHENEAVIRSIVEQRDWLCGLAEKTASLQREAEELQTERDALLQRLGPEWSPDRLNSVDINSDTGGRMVQFAHRYQSALLRRSRLRRRYRRLANQCQQQSAELNQRLNHWSTQDSALGSELDEAIESARRGTFALEELTRLTHRRQALQQRRRTLNDQLERFEARPPVPRWAATVLAAFGLAGMGFVVLGMAYGVALNVLAGAIYVLLGATGIGIGRALKTSAAGTISECSERLQHELRDIEARIRETKQAVDNRPMGLRDEELEMWEESSGAEDRSHSSLLPRPSSLQLSDHLLEMHRRTAELEELAGRQRRIQLQRRRLSEFRSRLRDVQREVAATRQKWCDLLVEVGLPETVRIDEAFRTQQRISQAVQLHRRWQTASEEHERCRAFFDTFLGPIQKLTRIDDSEVGVPNSEHVVNADDSALHDPQSLAHKLASWEESLHVFEANRAERRRLRDQEQTRRREADGYQTQIDELSLQRKTLFAQAGAATQEEFEQRCNLVNHRRELEELLEVADAELTAASQTEPDLALAEEDLLAYDAEENQECIEALNRELRDLDEELHQAYEKRGSLKQEIGELEADRRSAHLRLERHQSSDRLKRMLEQWCALQLAGRTIEQIRTRFERDNQPGTLQAASVYLRQLTGGRYRRIWTPLTERKLLIDDEQGWRFRIEQLSGGTREQLFLAVRLALVKDFTERGVMLPMILDDVLVNFDQHRSEAAVETLIDFAKEGRQILLFTCHQHLAQLFESRGIEPIRLPEQTPPELRRAG